MLVLNEKEKTARDEFLKKEGYDPLADLEQTLAPSLASKKEGNLEMDKPFDPTKPVQTRDGRPARIICTDGKHHDSDFRIWALVEDMDGDEFASPYSPNGLWGTYQKHPNPMDLINVPERKSKFVALYRSTNRHDSVGGYKPITGCYSGITKYDTLEECVKMNRGDDSVCNILEYVLEDDKLVDVKFHAGKGVLA